ncbi:MAG: ABC transporter substrate-binding protein [Eubacteriales bacterium]|nr:ABC transporter substrate-binding protein [Eubacteriales bacterium]
MKLFKRLVSALLLAAMLVTTLAACKKKNPTDDPDNPNKPSSKYDTERDPVRFAIEGQDGVFNPFFSTTAYDSEIAGQTQIGMLTVSGKNATISFGENQACVTLDFTETRLDENGNPISGGTDGNTAYTEYAFLIKNGIKFSDGTPLTIKDVLFNLYVYLDPVYTGNATIYSTDIVGLTEYRTQGEAENEEEFNSGFVVKAEARMQAIYDYCQYMIRQSNPTAAGGPGILPSDTKQVLGDIEIVKTLFKEELATDYQTAIESLEDYQKEYTIDTVWQLFLYLEGITPVMVNSSTGYQVKDENGKYKIDYSTYIDFVNDYVNENYKRIQSANAGMSEADAKAAAEKEYVTDIVWKRYIEYEAGSLNYSGIQGVIFGSASQATMLERFTAEAKTDYFADIKASGELAYPTISGITTEKTKNFNGVSYDDEHDVLKIRINKVDPKAIWNFAFTVAPMHYYSNEETIKNTRFGVDYGSTDFMNNVVKDPDKLGVPVGAGPYKASKQGGLADGEKYPSKDKFCQNNIIYYERNTYFETVGKELNNAKIKYIRYQVINSAQTIATLGTDGIDVGTPSGTADNIAEIAKYSHLSMKEVDTNGYGYVGINPKFVPDVAVRRAIMHAMDTALVLNYYPEGSCTRIFWPISTTSWAYPKDNRTSPYYQYKTSEEILNMLVEAGYEQRTDEKGNKMLGKKDEAGVWKQLTYTFTIPGSSNDHPAALMFERAAESLNSIGFKISVKTDNWALKKLATGDLAVWAAAWSSTIDPDMYQVYHIESNAGSTSNWGYPAMKSDRDKYSYELEIVTALSELIDKARETTVQSERIPIYKNALEKVMELAVEMPTYQRKDLTVFNSAKIDRNSLTPDSEIGPNNGLFARIWEMDFVH